MLKRPRRNRRTSAIRSLIGETHLNPADFVLPFFVLPGENQKQNIPSLPGLSRLTCDHILREAEKYHAKGVPAIALFPVVGREEKDPLGAKALD